MDLSDRIEHARRSPRRLAALRATGALDAASSETLDRCTRLAAELLGAPAAFLSLIDVDRDFYASTSGVGEPLALSRELRGSTFCHFTLVSDGPVVIDNTHTDPVHRAVPTVASLGIRAYMGIPLALNEDVIGSLCVVDFMPRPWSTRELQLLTTLAGGAQRELALQALLDERDRSIERADAEHRRLDADLRSRRSVMNSVAHDLRSPLNTILVSLSSIAGTTLEPRATKAAGVATRQARHMLGILEELLDDARLVDGTMRLATSPVDVAELLDEIVTDAEATATNAGIALSATTDADVPLLVLDRPRIVQVFANLLGNALRFTPRGGSIALRARLDVDSVEIEVRDSGSGIDAELLHRLFEPYVQGVIKPGSGLGLGLHIARSIVALHGGSMSASSNPKGGAVLTMRLPRVRADSTE